jgi:hypothetical protein
MARLSPALLATPAVLSAALLAAACGGGPDLPALGPDRASGQSSLMDRTAAGQKTCNTSAHDRPFIIEWDATDMAMFEGRAATDVVLVQYEGCELRVLDGCANDSVRGALGAYRPVEWTSGSIEKIDISDEGELYAKLPLGVATLGGRVQAGEKFTMEYFVSGIRTATRSAVYQEELAKIPGCKAATHFVYGMSIGAFGLGSQKKLAGSVDVAASGIGAGGSRVTSSNAEKKGGVIESCRADTAKEVRTCQVPIRLMLRPIEKGADPDAGATADRPAGDAPPAGPPPSRSDRSEITMEETKLRESAARKRVARDGKGCLVDLDTADKQFPNSMRSSTRPDGMLNIRAACLMLAGQCDAGKRLLRQAYEHMGMPANSIDPAVDIEAKNSCPQK